MTSDGRRPDPAGDGGRSHPYRGPLQDDTRIIDAAPELLLCAALVGAGRADGSGACVIFDLGDRFGLAATDEAAEASVELEFSLWEGPGPEVIATHVPVVTADLQAEGDRWPRLIARNSSGPIRSSAVVPLLVDGTGVGLLTAHRYTVDPFDEDDLADLVSVSRAMGVLAAAHLADSSDPPSVVSRAVGMVMERWQVSATDAMAAIRAHAFVQDLTLPALARALVARTADLGEPPASAG